MFDNLDLNEDITIVLEDDTIDISLCDDEVILDTQDQIGVIDIKNVQHNKLKGLSYDESGHTGFMRSDLSVLEPVSSDSDRETLYLPVSDEQGVVKKISLFNLIDEGKEIVQGEDMPDDIKPGQYFYKINKEV